MATAAAAAEEKGRGNEAAAVRQQQWGSSNEAPLPHLFSKKEALIAFDVLCVSSFAFSVLGSPIGLCVFFFLCGVLLHPPPVKGKSLVL